MQEEQRPCGSRAHFSIERESPALIQKSHVAKELQLGKHNLMPGLEFKKKNAKQ